jgi:tRNA nucleotidyltransferase/poly(A) polymerase
VGALLARLVASGREAVVLGACARDLARGVVPASFEIATAAPLAELLALFPRGAVTGRDQLTLASAAGPVDVHPFRGGDGLEVELTRRDFTLHALAITSEGAWLDPHGGRADLAAGRLRATADPEARFSEDPLRALRAARLVSELGVDLEFASFVAAQRVAAKATMQLTARVRGELARLLLGPHVEAGLLLLRRLGIESALAEDVEQGAPAIVARLPRDLELRLAAWLRGARAIAVLRGLRFPRARVLRVERLLQMHPIDAGPSQLREQRIKRLARRHEDDLRALLALREAEIAVRGEGEEAARRLAPARSTAEHALRADRLADSRATLALGGEDVMRHLGIGPGTQVGRALRHLAARVAADPSCNTREALLALLDGWAATQRGAAAPGSVA